MKALVYRGAGDARYEDVPVPSPLEGEVLVKISHGGICGSDLTVYAGKHWRGTPGIIMGHEFSGEVVEVRSAGSDLRPGERVVVEPLTPCKVCNACVEGAYNACTTLKLHGIDLHGCFAEYVVAPSERVYRIPASLPLKTAAVVEPTAVACHVVRRSNAKLGHRTVVLGGGPIGLLVAQVARLVTSMPVDLVEVSPWRLDLARKLGFDPIDPGKADIKEEILSRTNGFGADVTYDCAGAAPTAALFAAITRIRGQVVQVAMPHDLRPVDLAGFAFKELEYIGSRTYDYRDYHAAISMVAEHKVDVESMISHVFPLSEGKAALDLAAKGTDTMKVLLKP
jgi:(R,R)-butanediol dehydrogenase / meso-butanediol dehydrogenase / diacetyl reductase